MKKKIFLSLIRIILFGIGIGIIYIIGEKTGWEKTFNTMLSLNVPKILIILFLPLSWILLHSAGWYILFDEKKKFKLIHIIGGHLASSALSELLPLGQAGGEPYRIYFVRKYYPREKSPNIIASVIIYNTIHTIATGIIIFIGFIMALSQISVSQKGKYIFLTIAIIGSISLFFFIQRQKKGLLGPLFEILSKIKIFQKFAERKKEKAYMVDERLNTFYLQHKIMFYISFIIIFIAKVLGVFEIYFIMSFIKHPISFEDSFLIFSATSFVQIMFFFFPSQIGASEGSIVYMVRLLGQPFSSGMALAILRRARAIIWTLVGWVIAHFYGPKIHEFK